jgi:hypothetical protein
MSFVLYLLLAWFIYQVIFKFIVPIYFTTRKIKKGFREMQEKMNTQPGARSNSNTPFETKTEKAPKPSKDDYIEFEEVSERDKR